MSEIKLTVNVDEYLSLNKYEVDESNAHIELVDDPSDEEFDKLILVCPAALYKRDEDGSGKTRSLPWVWSTASAKPSAYIAYKERSLRAPFFFYMSLFRAAS